jgi:hypothetical protein
MKYLLKAENYLSKWKDVTNKPWKTELSLKTYILLANSYRKAKLYHKAISYLLRTHKI